MTTTRRLITAAAGALGLALLSTPAMATQDLAIIVDTCPQMVGRDPPTGGALQMMGCHVGNPDDFTTTPSWGELELMYQQQDARGGLVATLQCMSRTTGALTDVARLRSVAGAGVRSVRVTLPAALGFSRCAYMVRVDVFQAPAGEVPRPLMVTLRNR